jgi:hypothetical protein
MKTPFTIEQFLEIFKLYNEKVFPIQIIFYLISIVAIYLLIKPSSKSDKIISSILAFFWIWMGVVYNLIFFTAINKAAYLFGGIFILQGILFLFLGVFNNKLSFRYSSDIYGVTGIVMILFALIIYPALGYFLGHIYPSSPTFGLPCPTTIFTFGILLFTKKRCPIIIVIIPLIWSIIGFTAVFNFRVFEDTGLLVSGIITFTLIILHTRISSKKNI